MQDLAFIGLGIGFLLMAGGLFALTLRKPKPAPIRPTKAQVRELADLAIELKKMRLAASIIAGVGAVLVMFSLI